MTRPIASPAGEIVQSGKGKLDIARLVIFLVIAFGGGWLVCLPLLLHPTSSPRWLVTIIPMVMMYTPALGVLVAVRLWRRPAPQSSQPTPSLGLRFGGSFRRCLPYLIAGLVIFMFVGLLAPFVAAAFGLVHLDLVHFSGYVQVMHSKLAGVPGAKMPTIPIAVLVIVQLAQIPVASIIPNGLLTFGEEIGWRGFLLPRLLPLGQWPALLIMGVIWGLWHTPLLLLGLNYPGSGLLSIPLMVGFTVITGILLGWLRLSSGSIWPTVIAHGAANATPGAMALFMQAGATYNPALAGIAGVTGWIIPAVIIVVLIIMRRLPVRNPH